MATIEEKLQKFSSYVLDDANKQRDEMLEQLEEEKKRKINSKELELLSDAYEEIQKTVSKSRRENNERVLKIEMTLKKELILRREQIIEEVFDSVSGKLAAYTKTSEYKDWLLKIAEKAVLEVGKGNKTVYVSEEDMQYKALLEQEFPQVQVKPTEEDDFIGGVKVFNDDKQVFVDYSLYDILQDQKHAFLQTSGLNIG